MGEQSDEQFYDAEVAPLLMQVAKLCEARGLPLLAIVEWKREPADFKRNPDDDNDDPQMFGKTAASLDKASHNLLAAQRTMDPPSMMAFTIRSGR